MLQRPKPRHYLAQLYRANEEPKPLRKVNLVVRALFPAPGLKTLYSMQVRVVSINETGAVLQARTLDYLPDHFYLCLGEKEIVMTCAKASVNNGSMTVSFALDEESDFIEALTHISFPLSTLAKLHGACAPVVARRIIKNKVRT